MGRRPRSGTKSGSTPSCGDDDVGARRAVPALTMGNHTGLPLLHFDGDGLGSRQHVVFRGGRRDLDLVLPFGHVPEHAIKALLVLAVKVDMGMRRLRPLDQLIHELEGAPNVIPSLAARTVNFG